jgi:hypothetical protein
MVVLRKIRPIMNTPHSSKNLFLGTSSVNLWLVMTVLVVVGTITKSWSQTAATYRFDNQAGNGLWTNATNWSSDTLPGSVSETTATASINNGYVVTLDAAAPNINALRLGNSNNNSATLNITGGSLTVTNVTSIASTTNSTGSINLSGGTFNAGPSLTLGTSVGTLGSGSLNVSGGALAFGSAILGYSGSTAINTFSVTGSAASSISGESMNLRNPSRLVFTLDGSGITTINLTSAISISDPSAALIVDVTGYSGLATTFTLLDASSFNAGTVFTNISVLGGNFSDLKQDATLGTITIDVVPEPSTYALLVLTAAGLGLHVLRRRGRRF